MPNKDTDTGDVADTDTPSEDADTKDVAEASATATDNADPSSVDASDVEQPVFDNCTEDCSGHEAGFAWARAKDLTDESECGGNSQSFIEGCKAFTEARQELAEDTAAEGTPTEDATADDTTDDSQ